MLIQDKNNHKIEIVQSYSHTVKKAEIFRSSVAEIDEGRIRREGGRENMSKKDREGEQSLERSDKDRTD